MSELQPGANSLRDRLLRGSAATLLGVAGGMGLRALLDPVLGATMPFIFAFPAVAFVALVAGAIPAVTTALISAIWAILPWLPPDVRSGTENLQVGTFLLSAIALAIICGRSRAVALAKDIAPRASDSVSLGWLRWSIVLACVLPTVFFCAVAWFGYRAALESSAARLDKTARIVEEHAARVIETNEVIARALDSSITDLSDGDITRQQKIIHERLQEITIGLPQIQSVWVWNSRGAPLVSNRFMPVPAGLDISDRDYFRWCRDNREGWFVSAPLISRTTGEPFFDISRRREYRDGSFAGVISVSLRPSYFEDFYRRLVESEPGLSLALLTTDGAFVARWPKLPDRQARLEGNSVVLQALNQGRTSGAFTGTSQLDGQQRQLSFRKIGKYPLHVVSRFDRAVILGEWNRQITVLAAITFPMTLGLVYVAFVALRRTQRQLATLEQLHAESEHRSRAEDALRHAQKLEALGQLTGGVAHDFNNLLMVVNTNVHLHTRMNPETGRSPQMQAVLRAVNAGAKLTRQLLAFSRRQALRPEAVNLQTALPAVEDLLKTTTGRAISVTVSVAPDTPMVEVDPAELELALINLTINARDAMPNGGRFAVFARAAAHDEQPGDGTEGRYVLISASDTGHGIPPEILDRVFEPFFTTKQPGEGTGLGLSQVYGFCMQAGGFVRIRTDAGIGTTVLLYLPRSDRKPAADNPVDAEPPECIDGHILLVEDNAEVAQATAALLESFGCRVTRAASAAEARSLIGDVPAFDAVLTDIVMPGPDNGLALATGLRSTHPSLPVVLMTGYAAEVHRAMAAGFDVLPKPCTPTVIARTLSRHLKSPAKTTSRGAGTS